MTIGLIMAFGVGALISAVSFELVAPAIETAEVWQVAVGLGLGSATFFIGDRLSALDIHWAAFAALARPLPPEHCAMPDGLRQQYTVQDPVVAEALTPILLEHRDFVYSEFLELPLTM